MIPLPVIIYVILKIEDGGVYLGIIHFFTFIC